MDNNMELNVGGIVCDNPECDWEDMSIKVEDYEQYVDAPCLKCGENILTQEDYKGVVDLYKAVEIAKQMTPEQMDEMVKNMSTEQMDQALDKMNELGFEKKEDDEDGIHNWEKKHDKHK